MANDRRGPVTDAQLRANAARELDLPPLERLDVVDVRPGDVLIATIDPTADPASAQGVHRLKTRLREYFTDHEHIALADRLASVAVATGRPDGA